MPLPWEAPYDVVLDRYGEAWEVNEAPTASAGSIHDRRVHRISAAALQQLSVASFVDDRTTPVTVWVGNNHGACVIKIEPLD